MVLALHNRKRSTVYADHPRVQKEQGRYRKEKF